eukprot:6214222-Pyramimonas_sp.AAC.1
MQEDELVFVSWDNGVLLGGSMPDPVWVRWDGSGRFCTLGYPHMLALYVTAPEFKLLGTLEIPDAVDAVWQRQQVVEGVVEGVYDTLGS